MTKEKHAGKHVQALVLIFAAWMAWGQSDAPLEFEVVSIKPSPPRGPLGFFGCRGGPGSNDPGLITCSHEAARSLVPIAYGMGLRVSYAKLNGGTNPPQFEIAAKVPHGATKEQVNQMWQNLLKDRFRLAVHRETQEMQVYEMVIAKGGLKAKEWVDRQSDAEVAPWGPGVAPKWDKEGFPMLAPGQTGNFFTGDKAYFAAPAGTMKVLAKMLESRLAINEGVPRPVIDATGLEGKYDLKFWWSPQTDSNDSAEGPSLLSALESQLGLRLQRKKSAPVEILVIDHIERTPTEN
jgi:uncharacterized protein (TIGR03435 family)